MKNLATTPALLVSIFILGSLWTGCGDECDELSDMRSCASAGDCVPVGCSCTCSGCGGFSFEDVVNKKCEDRWYHRHDCKPTHVCPEVCCPPRTLACENRMCSVK
jgi:hypothetical protein